MLQYLMFVFALSMYWSEVKQSIPVLTLLGALPPGVVSWRLSVARLPKWVTRFRSVHAWRGGRLALPCTDCRARAHAAA